MKTTWTAADVPSQKGKIVIITGSNTGLGFEAVRIMCKKEASVIMAVRNVQKGREAKQIILKETPEANIDVMSLDLADINSIHSFSNEFHEKYKRLDILMNNAGVMWPPKRETTKQGFELQFGINHLGHFVLTALLLDVIKKTDGARVVTQSSIAHNMQADIHFNDLNWEKSYNRTKAYAQSKLANLLFTYELDRYLKANAINAIAVAAHPGVSATKLFRSANAVMSFFTAIFAQKAEKGALGMLRASTQEGLKGSEYFGPAQLRGAIGYPKLIISSKKSRDLKLAKELWEVSEKITGITYKF